ncbi:Spy/CpxP family protein refolding chaperone [uncultured Rhodoblastus sp.]|uniref:Spy/CpxP family protein refolding chaperone n=1 Tax=uncultured Rhodoblastus sp. TaxID=543037 RepID=UPI0025E98166|nr:Spy/CpxP family protein refolding chaperone [uncultured Rhodoblastus sp.]
MKKRILIGLASAALTGFPLLNGSIAQTDNKTPAAQAERNTGPADNQIANEVDARIAHLKAQLNLSVDQEKNWPGLQSALHDYGVGQLKHAIESENRPSRRERARQGQERPNEIGVLRTIADNLAARGASLKKLADAAEPLYATLDERQQHELFQFLRTDFERRHG